MTAFEISPSSRTSAPITLSQAAALRLNALSKAEGRRLMLRVAVDGGGCSGFQYRFDLVEAAEPDDLTVERDGAAAVVDLVSLDLLRGAVIDFADELAAAEFRVRNPNAKSSCGCGVSFSV
jgi:iron-sulfur cluster assembly accessory protein